MPILFQKLRFREKSEVACSSEHPNSGHFFSKPMSVSHMAFLVWSPTPAPSTPAVDVASCASFAALHGDTGRHQPPPWAESGLN